MKIITGATGQNHINSNDDGEFNQGIYGDLAVLPLGSALQASIINNNTIQIGDGDIVFQGRHALIAPDTTETVSISTGAVGYNRIDLIVARYRLNSATGYESISLEVIEGTPATGSPAVPSATTGNIRRGAIVADAVLYQVTITGVSITEVKKMFTPLSNSIVDILANKLDALTMDSKPTSGSSNPVTSNGIYSALQAKSDTTHKHVKTDITDFAHTHTKSNITDFAHTHAKSEVGLANVDNTADANKTVNKANYANITTLSTASLKNIVVGVGEPTSTLETGTIYFQIE